uniref:Uncharacterized protein n=1 Tax=Arundo donax TaxID=35708 RepID=A0A0A9BNC3_ARUDO
MIFTILYLYTMIRTCYIVS